MANTAAFHHGLHYLVEQNDIQKKNYWEIITMRFLDIRTSQAYLSNLRGKIVCTQSAKSEISVLHIFLIQA